LSAAEQRCALLHANELPSLTLSCLSEDDAKIIQWPNKVLSGLGRECVSKLSPNFLSGLDKHQFASLDPMAAGGLSFEQLDAIDCLSPKAFEYLDPSVLADMTADQLNSIPVEALNCHISKDQMAAIDPEKMETMIRFEQIGSRIDPMSPHHPCLGIGARHTNAFSLQMAMKYRRHCKPVLDSHRLQQQGKLYNYL
jgi:hypothetical protein